MLRNQKEKIDPIHNFKYRNEFILVQIRKVLRIFEGLIFKVQSMLTKAKNNKKFLKLEIIIIGN